MSDWLDQLHADLDDRRRDARFRTLRVFDRCGPLVRCGNRTLINFASNDYLGLASHPRLRHAVAEAALRVGCGAGSSRLVAGHLEVHERVERRFAAFKHAEAALLTPTGFAANFAVLTSLAGEDDVVLLDKLCHASLIDAARASGAQVRVFPHRNLDKLRKLLGRYRSARRRFIVIDSVFSMDGDCADLPALCGLRDEFAAILVVDEAHATGVLGATGSGLAEEQGVAGKIDVTVSTAGKALGSLGGVVTSSRVVIETLVNHARAFIDTTAVPPTQAAAIEAALDVVRDEPERRSRLRELSRRIRGLLRESGWEVPDDPTPIVPLIVGDNQAALDLSQRLEAAGYLVPAIRPPTVAPGSARLRLSLRSDLSDWDVEGLVATLGTPRSTSAIPR